MKMQLMAVLMSGIMIGSMARADLLLQDFFDDGNLATSSQTNGGFSIIGSGGQAIEDGSAEKLRISNAANGSQYGVISLNKVSLGSEQTLRTTWVITDSSLKNNAESLVFTWQLGSGAIETSPNIALVLDVSDGVENGSATVLLNGSTNHTESISADFGQVNDAFTVEMSFNSSEFSFLANENQTKEVRFFSGNRGWLSSSPAVDDIYLSAYVNGKASNGLVVEFDSVTVEAIPEPVAITLVGSFGVGMLFIRRWFGKP